TRNATATTGTANANNHTNVIVIGECGATRRNPSATARSVSQAIDAANSGVRVCLTNVLAPRIRCPSRIAAAIATPTDSRSRQVAQTPPIQAGWCALNMKAFAGHRAVQLANWVGTG